jgi:DNA-binding LacI/PurR family transcriptional regulator
MALTIKHIAALAKVSKGTVSKVVRGSCGFAGQTGAAKEA